ncbi:MAG: hypothetical protein LBD16_09235, partial [Oscillospiraceae bacterium]|nr:hypothetical protein [Oscillospiraceae bacterium]
MSEVAYDGNNAQAPTEQGLKNTAEKKAKAENIREWLAVIISFLCLAVTCWGVYTALTTLNQMKRDTELSYLPVLVVEQQGIDLKYKVDNGKVIPAEDPEWRFALANYGQAVALDGKITVDAFSLLNTAGISADDSDQNFLELHSVQVKAGGAIELNLDELALVYANLAMNGAGIEEARSFEIKAEY